MGLVQRPLQGCSVGLSISESDDSAQLGFPSWQVNRVTIQVSAALLGQGATMVFGHDWRDDGVMEAVHRLALQMEPPPPAFGTQTNPPLMLNLLPWPDKPRLSEEERAQLAATLRVEEAGLPEELKAEGEKRRSAGIFDAYLRSRALTHLRRQLNRRIAARICIGGRIGGSQGLYPGVIEEAAIAFEHGTPLYLAGLLGGATRQIIDAIEGLPLRENFCQPTKVTAVYEERGEPVRGRDAIWQDFGRNGLSNLARANLLSDDENKELFQTLSLDRVIELILTGLGRLWKEGI
jgi:hypothetical protein